MNDPDRRSDDPLYYAPKWARDGDHAERPNRTRGPRDLDAPARRTRDQAEENIGRSATPAPGEGVKWARVPLLVASNTGDSDTGPEFARRAHGRFATFGLFALAISIAAITAFLVVW